MLEDAEGKRRFMLDTFALTVMKRERRASGAALLAGSHKTPVNRAEF
jgi:hypothetical protein